MEPSLRRIVAVMEWLGIDRSLGAEWTWTPRLAETESDPPTGAPSRGAVDEKQIEVAGEKQWLYAAIDIESNLLLEVDVYSSRGVGPAAALLTRPIEKYEVSDTELYIHLPVCGNFVRRVRLVNRRPSFSDAVVRGRTTPPL